MNADEIKTLIPQIELTKVICECLEYLMQFHLASISDL